VLISHELHGSGKVPFVDHCSVEHNDEDEGCVDLAHKPLHMEILSACLLLAVSTDPRQQPDRLQNTWVIWQARTRRQSTNGSGSVLEDSAMNGQEDVILEREAPEKWCGLQEWHLFRRILNSGAQLRYASACFSYRIAAWQ